MPDPHLIGNGEWCSSCCPDGAPPDLEPERFRFGCNECAGKGRVAYSAETIVNNTLAQNRAWRKGKTMPSTSSPRGRFR